MTDVNDELRFVDSYLDNKARLLKDYEEELTGVRRITSEITKREWLLTRTRPHNLIVVSQNGRTPDRLSGKYTTWAQAITAIHQYEQNAK